MNEKRNLQDVKLSSALRRYSQDELDYVKMYGTPEDRKSPQKFAFPDKVESTTAQHGRPTSPFQPATSTTSRRKSCSVSDQKATKAHLQSQPLAPSINEQQNMKASGKQTRRRHSADEDIYVQMYALMPSHSRSYLPDYNGFMELTDHSTDSSMRMSRKVKANQNVTENRKTGDDMRIDAECEAQRIHQSSSQKQIKNISHTNEISSTDQLVSKSWNAKSTQHGVSSFARKFMSRSGASSPAVSTQANCGPASSCITTALSSKNRDVVSASHNCATQRTDTTFKRSHQMSPLSPANQKCKRRRSSLPDARKQIPPLFLASSHFDAYDFI